MDDRRERIIHQEMPQPSERMLGTQLWINLPREEKMADPSYGDLHAEDIPAVEEEGTFIKHAI